MNDEHVLDRAARALRELTDEGWVRARPSVMERAVRALRPSVPVRGRHEHGEFTVSADVLVARITAALDARPDVRTLGVTCQTEPDGALRAVAIMLSARFGTPIPAMAASLRVHCAEAVTAVLGTRFSPDRVAVDLHVADVDPPAVPLS